jgi:GAF domain-containing protein
VPQIEALQGVQPEKDFPWFTEVIQSQDFVHVPDVAELPPEAQKEREYFQNRSIKSLVVIAMRQGENLIGFLGFDNIYETKTWSEDEIVIFRIIGEAFTSAIQRKQAEREQEKLQAQLSNAVDLAHLGPWELDVEKRMFTFNDHFYKIYHTTAEEMGGYTMSLDEYAHKFIHPDDMHVVDRSERMGRDPNAEPERVEHRMFYADGSPGICNVPDVPCKK